MDLDQRGAALVDAAGNSYIPRHVERALGDGRKTSVLYVKDALARPREQAPVVQNAAVKVHHLQSDFEGAFDLLLAFFHSDRSRMARN